MYLALSVWTQTRDPVESWRQQNSLVPLDLSDVFFPADFAILWLLLATKTCLGSKFSPSSAIIAVRAQTFNYVSVSSKNRKQSRALGLTIGPMVVLQTPSPSVRRNATDDFLNSLGLREVAPEKKLKADGVQAEVRARRRSKLDRFLCHRCERSHRKWRNPPTPSTSALLASRSRSASYSKTFWGASRTCLTAWTRLDAHTRQVPVVPTPAVPPTASVPPPPYSGPTSMPPAAALPPALTTLPKCCPRSAVGLVDSGSPASSIELAARGKKSCIDKMSQVICDTLTLLHSSDMLKKLHAEFLTRYKGFRVLLVHLRSGQLVKPLCAAGVADLRERGGSRSYGGRISRLRTARLDERQGREWEPVGTTSEKRYQSRKRTQLSGFGCNSKLADVRVYLRRRLASSGNSADDLYR
ncbi:hypothetical protein B0H11DRAFT_2429010 [Mycena galericulata]|nr:hypothetical protein B0H11DRAFT_2429010 [Mycena galericulata]